MTVARRTAGSFTLALAAGAAAVLLVSEPAGAHTGKGAGGVIDGILHPLTGPDHLLAMLAVGIVAVLATPRGRVWLAPVAFLGGMAAGGVAGLAGGALPGAEYLIVASVFVLGLAIAGAAQGAGDWLIAALIVAGIAHGHAHGAEAPTSANPVAYVGGFLLATAALHLVGVGMGAAIKERRTLRIGIGAATVAAGALLIA